MLTSLTLVPPRPPPGPPVPGISPLIIGARSGFYRFGFEPAFRNLAQLLHVAGVIIDSRREIFDNDLLRNDPTLILSHLMHSFLGKKTFTDRHKQQFCKKIDFADVRRRGWSIKLDLGSFSNTNL